MKFNASFLATLIFFIKVYEIQTWRSFVMDFTGVEVTSNKELVHYADLKLVKLPNYHAINGTVKLKRDSANPQVKFVVSVPRGNIGNWSLMNATFDICKILPKTADDEHNLLYIFIKQLQATKKHFPRQCPLEKDKIIYFDNMHLDAESFPPLIPEMSFVARLEFIEAADWILTTTMTGYIQSKRSLRKSGRKRTTQ